jgi:biopolymer transport protein ExbD
MNSILKICVTAIVLSNLLIAQNPTAPVMQPVISVQLPVSNQAVAVPDADQKDATVVTVSSRGDIYVGTQPVTNGEIAGLSASTIYLKADARAPYQQVLTVLSVLTGHRVVLLTEATAKAAPETITPPYGVSVTVGGR